MKLTVALFLSILSFVTLSEASVAEKCANVAKAITGNEDELKVVNGDVVPVNTHSFSRYSATKDQTEMHKGQKKIVFVKLSGRINHINDGNRVHILDGNCNLFQTYQRGAKPSDTNSLLYDKEICKSIGKVYTSMGMKQSEAAKCDQLSEKVQNLINAKNKELAKIQADKVPMTINKENNFTALDYVTRCAYQANYEKKLDGKVAEAEKFSREWFLNAFNSDKKSKDESSAAANN